MKSYSIEKIRGVKCFVLQGDWSDQCLKVFERKRLKAIDLNISKGWTRDISFIGKLERLRYISILTDYIRETAPLYECPNIKGLHLSGTLKDSVDLSKFPDLEELSICWSNKVHSLFQCQKLRELYIDKYKPQSRDLSDFGNLPNLESLRLDIPTIDRIGQIGCLEKLKKIKIAMATKLVSIDGIEALKSLERLELDTCRKIEDFSILGELTNLRHLDISNNGKIEDIRFVKNLKKLKEFYFAETTDIVAGDLSPVLSLPKLKYAGFQERRHYNLRWKDVPPYQDHDLIFEELGFK